MRHENTHPDTGPETPATKFLHKHRIAHSNHLYEYEEHGGTKVSARELNVAEHAVVKTLVMEDEAAKPLIVLMHGDRKVSTKELARQIGVKKVGPCKPEDALRHTGYMVGGCSPFGTKKGAASAHGEIHPRPAAGLHQRWAARLPGRRASARHPARAAAEDRGMCAEGMSRT
jgi:Cys-tRNA(Pro) deacylase